MIYVGSNVCLEVKLHFLEGERTQIGFGCIVVVLSAVNTFITPQVESYLCFIFTFYIKLLCIRSFMSSF